MCTQGPETPLEIHIKARNMIDCICIADMPTVQQPVQCIMAKNYCCLLYDCENRWIVCSCTKNGKTRWWRRLMLLTRVAGSMDRRRGKLQGPGQLRDLAVVRGQVKHCTKLLHILCKCSAMQTPRHLHADLEQSAGFCGNEFCMSNEIIPTLFCLVEVSLLLLIEDYYTKFTLCDFIFCLIQSLSVSELYYSDSWTILQK